MLYSGYLSRFAKGFGGLPLSQTGFNIADLLTLIPATFLLFIKAGQFLINFILFYFVLPIVIAYITSAIPLNKNIEELLGGNVAIANIGVIVWMISTTVGAFLFSSGKKGLIISIIICCIGAALFGLTVSPLGYSTTNSQISILNYPLVSGILNLINQILALLLVVELFFAPYLIGIAMGDLSIKQKLLSEISQLILKESVPIKGTIKSTQSVRKVKNNVQVYEYNWVENKPIYLIAAFSQTTAIFLPPATRDDERGEMLLLRNELINSMVLKGYKEEKQEDVKDENKKENSISFQEKVTKPKKTAYK
jgi:hypothetical protein